MNEAPIRRRLFQTDFSMIWRNGKELTKIRLSLSVVFSSVAGYLLGATIIDYSELTWLAVGGYCMVGASNVFNQIIERDLDALMKRTMNRPIPKGRVSVNDAFALACVLTISGLIILYNINPKTAMFGAVSIFLYTCVYTPLKTKTSLSVLVGAIPGAIPFMLGWVAATNDFDIEPGILFIIQFFWQFPHFWSIAWFLHDDYQKAGFKMLPTEKPDKASAAQIIFYSFWTVVVSILPVFGITGKLTLSITGAIIIGVFGVILTYFAIRLFSVKTSNAAKKLLLISVLYITFLQIVYVVDKFL